MWPDDKFICGNEISVTDIYIGGYFYNNILNPKSEFFEAFERAMAIHSTQRVNKYLSDFYEVF